jgi:hypothetical protein
MRCGGLGVEAWRAGDHSRAAALAREVVGIDHVFSDRRGIALALELLAWIAAAEQQAERAARLQGAADAVWKIFDAPLSGYTHLANYHLRCEASAREALGERSFQAAFDSAGQLTLEQARCRRGRSGAYRCPRRVH